MKYTVTVTRTAGTGRARVQCLKWADPSQDPVEVPIDWEGNVGTMELDGGVHALAVAIETQGDKFEIDLDPPSPIFDPPGAPWPYKATKAVQLFFVVGG